MGSGENKRPFEGSYKQTRWASSLGCSEIATAQFRFSIRIAWTLSSSYTSQSHRREPRLPQESLHRILSRVPTMAHAASMAHAADPFHQNTSIQLGTADVIQIQASRGIVSWACDRALLLSWAALVFIVINYVVQVSRFHSSQRTASKEEPQAPPRYPSLIPWLGHALPFALDNMRFMESVA